MLFVWFGLMREDGEAVPQEVQRQTTEFLQQPYIDIRSVGPLRDAEGKRAAMMMIFDADNRATAEALVQNSPYLNAGLYREHRLYEFDDEIG
jgi:uncharacterized protein YciI